MSDLQANANGRAAPTVSVVMVFYNTRAYLDEAVRSVLEQTLQDWELILVDDGATDGSAEIARRHADCDPRVRYVHHPRRKNRGISASRNLGAEEARGRFIAQLDSDDVLLPFHLEQHVAALREHPEAAMAYGPVQRWYSWNGDPADRDSDFVALPLDHYDRLIHPPSLIPVMLQRPYGVPPSGFVCRREAMEDVGRFEDAFRGVYDDQVFFVKLTLEYPVYVLSRWSYRYRRHPASIVSVTNSSDQWIPHRLRFLEWVEGHLDQEGVADRQVRRALGQELWKCRHPRLSRGRGRLVGLGRRIRRRIGRALRGVS